MRTIQTIAVRVLGIVILSSSAPGQTQNVPTQPDMSRVLERLDRLEQENRELLLEIRQLRTELHDSKPLPAVEATGMRFM